MTIQATHPSNAPIASLVWDLPIAKVLTRTCMFGSFLARAVVDEVLAPDRNNTHFILSISREQVWGPGDGRPDAEGYHGSAIEVR